MLAVAVTARRPGIARLAISVLGAGRMGQQLLREMAGTADLRLAGLWVRPDSPLLGTDLSALAGDAAQNVDASPDLDAVVGIADVAIDFSLAAATPAVIAAAVAARTPLVCGVSGLDAAALRVMREAAQTIPVFYDRNMSIGIAVMRRLASLAATALGDEFAVEIHDRHHAKKRDAPSGTALALGEILAASRGQRLDRVMRYDPQGRADVRDRSDIVFRVTREGDCPGRHDVVFAGKAEQLTLRHEVSDRAVFALGALRAGRWLAPQAPGLYDMEDLLEHLAAAR